MNRPTSLLKEIEEFGARNEYFYGLEIGSSDCNRIIDYIDQLENALDKACEKLISVDSGYVKEQLKKGFMENEQ